MSDWYPHAIRVPANRSSGAYADGYPWRGVIHTTESDTYTPSAANYFGHSNYPHFTVDGNNVYQHVPLDRYAFALANASGGVETNRARAVQIEVVARAAKPDWPDATVNSLRQAMRWIEAQTGITHDHPRFVGYPASYGVAADQRMSVAKWRAFNGWCGHQHVPENSHGDPGAIGIGALLEDDMPLSKDDVDRIAKAVRQEILGATFKDGTDVREAIRRTHRRTERIEEALRDIAKALPSVVGGDAATVGQFTDALLDKLAARLEE